MFAFASPTMFVEPWSWASPGMSQSSPWHIFDVPGTVADDAGRYSSHARSSAACCTKDQSRGHLFRNGPAGTQRHSSHRRSQLTPQADQPAAGTRKPTTAKSHSVQRKNSSSEPSSSSSYYSAGSDCPEPMDVCCVSQPPCPPEQQQQQQQQHCCQAEKISHISSGRSSGHSSNTQRADDAHRPAMKRHHRQQQQQSPAILSEKPSIARHKAATVIQAAWRMHRLSRHRQSLKQLAAATAQLSSIASQLGIARHEAAAAAAAVEAAITQKQFLELSEPVMRVLFLLDAVNCGSVVELRGIRKQLTTRANQLLDDIQAAYGKAPAAQRLR